MAHFFQNNNSNNIYGGACANQSNQSCTRLRARTVFAVARVRTNQIRATPAIYGGAGANQ